MFQQFKKGQIVFHTKTKRQGKVVKQEGASTVVEFIISQDSEQGTRTTKVENILTHELRSSKPKRHSYAPYFDVMEFHKAFGHPVAKVPTPISAKRMSQRAGYQVEEVVESLWASVDGKEEEFVKLVDVLLADVEKAKQKAIDKGEFNAEETILHQVDSQIDILYFTYGTLVELGVNPKNIFTIVQNANLGKLGADGKPILHPETNKILKPEGWEEKYQPEPLIEKEITRQIEEATKHGGNTNE